MTSYHLKHILLLLCIIVCVLSRSAAQNKPGVTIKGTIKNTKDEPVDGATLFLKDSDKGQVAKQGMSNQDGTFVLDAVPGNYVLSISYLGALSYQSGIIKVAEDLNLGSIQVAITSRSLKEVMIQSVKDKPILEIEGRKLIYNVQNSITSQGTNALEVLRKTPGVIVNQDNTITLNGASGALVMVNGRQTYLQAEELAQLLKSLPSSDLKSIEVIKNPSAEYDAAGTGGIINLVLQKLTIQGFNGSMNNGLAYGKTLKQNTNINLNLRQGNLNLFARYNHNFGYYAMDYDNDRTTNGKIYLNTSHDVDKQRSVGSTVGADYFIDTTKTIGIVVNANFRNGGGVIDPITHIFDQPSGDLLQTLRSQSTYPVQHANRYSGNLNYRYKGNNSQTLDIDADFGYFDSATDNLSTNTFYLPDGQFQSSNNFLVSNSKDIKLYALKADYGFSVGIGKMMTGAKLSSVNSDNVFNRYDANGSQNVIDIDLSNTFKYTERITAGYLKYESQISKQLSMDIGVRLEHTHSDGNLQPREGNSQQATTVTRNYLNIFPTAGLNYKTEHSGTYNLSFARRIDRPAYNSLNPFSYPVDELSYWTGNPFLQPQYTNTLSLQYSYKSTTIAAGYTHTTDLSSSVTEVLDSNRVIMVPRNIGLQNNFNLTVTQQLKLTAWWNMSMTAIGYHLENNVGTIQYGSYTPSRFSGTANVQQTFKLPGHITAEISSVVNSKRIAGLNTYIKGNSQVDLGLQKNVLQDKATIRLTASDIFRSNRYNTDSELNGLLLHTTYAGETRQVRLNFSYRFGNSKIKSKANRESGLENENNRLP